MVRKVLIGALALSISFGVLAQAPSLRVKSNSIVDGKIQKVHACYKQGGKDQSPHIEITGIPPNSRFLAIIMDDPDAVKPAGKVWVHWNLFNIPNTDPDRVFEAGIGIDGDAGRSSGGSKGYEGMCPPDGVHTYRFAVFALSNRVELGGFFGPSAMTIEDFEKKFSSLVLGKGLIEGSF